MKDFENRRDRFELFDSFESPLLNITFNLEIPDFRGFCKENGYPPFHFFLYVIFQSLMKVENFRYRIFKDEVIMVNRLIPSYTVMNQDRVLNFTQFENTDDLKTFIDRSLKAGEEAKGSRKMVNSVTDLSERDRKDYVYITCIPWLDFTSIQHPVGKLNSVDIPAIAWGKFRSGEKGMMTMPFSVQVHHGFVDGYHIHLLAQEISQEISRQMITS